MTENVSAAAIPTMTQRILEASDLGLRRLFFSIHSEPHCSPPEGQGHTTSHHLNHLKAILCLLLAILIWSGWVVMNGFGMKNNLTPYDITAIRFTTAGILLLPMIIKNGVRIGPWGAKGGFVLSLLLGATYTNVVVFGLQFAPVSHASTVNTGTFLTLITIFGFHGLREHIPRIRLMGIVCSLIGIAIMLSAKGTIHSPSQWIGHLCFMTGATMWAVYVLLTRAWKADPVHTTAVVCVFSMLSYMPLYLLFADHQHLLSCPWKILVMEIIYQGILTSIVSLFLFNVGVSILGAARSGAFVPLIPAISTLLAIPALHQVPSVMESLGIATVSIGVFLASGVISMAQFMKR